MITIKSVRNTYSFDEKTNKIFKDSKELTNEDAEPVYTTNLGNIKFAGIYLKGLNKILGLSGNLNSVTLNDKSIK